MYPKYHQARAARERGQTTIALAGVLAVGCLAAVAISIIAQAMVHRAHARTAADAVALATAAEPASAQALYDWYGTRGITVQQEGERTIARSGPAQAAAWASTSVGPTQPAPALVAIIARAEQLQATTFEPLRWNDTQVTLSQGDALLLSAIAAELSLCEVDAGPEVITFEIC